MGRLLVIILILVTLLGGAYFFLKSRGMEKLLTNPQNLAGITPVLNINKSSGDATGMNLKLPAGYDDIAIFANDLRSPRDLEIDPKGNLLVSEISSGKVTALPTKKTVVDGLNRPHGIAFYKDKLYVAETHGVSTFDYDSNSQSATNKKKIIDLPSGGNHFTRSIIFKNDKLYVSTGSSCNVCVEGDTRRAAIWVANLDGSDFTSFAQGLRNSVFMALHPKTGELWATDMGRDLIGDNIPPEEVNIIKEGNHYGWPYCYGNKIVDQETNPTNSKFNCSNSTSPLIEYQAHSAPLGLAFLGNDLLVAYHGSWNRTVPTGYKVVRFPFDQNGNKTGEPEDFISGWLVGEEATGRPVDILVKDKEIYISDDKAGVVYLLTQN